MNEYHKANRARWNLASKRWVAMHDRRGTWRHAQEKPEAVLYHLELELLDGVEGQRACVLYQPRVGIAGRRRGAEGVCSW